MRHERFELDAGSHIVIDKTNEEMEKKEKPFDMVEVRVLEEYSGSTINLCNKQKGEL